MKKLFIIMLLCIGFIANAQEHNIIFYSEYHTENGIFYKQPVFIIITDVEIKIVDVKSYSILNSYNWIASKVEKSTEKESIYYKAIDDSGTLYNFVIAYYFSRKETVFGIKELNIIFRNLKRI